MSCNTCDTAEEKYFVGDFGTDIYVDLCSPIVDATSLSIIVSKPDGTVETWVATPASGDAEETRIKYTTVDGDWDQVGTYIIVGKIQTASGSWTGDKDEFKVESVF